MIQQFYLEEEEEQQEQEELEVDLEEPQQHHQSQEREVEVINNNYHPNQFLQPNQLLHRNHHHPSQQNQNLTDETDDLSIENDRVEYAVLLPDSFAILESTFDDELNYIL